jgi:hypothetical protein
MKWQEYEKTVYEEFRHRYPTAEIRWDVMLPGNLSGTERQIDILIDATVGGQSVRTIVDAKMYNKPVNVKDVEKFLGLMKDVSAQRGLMVTTIGYSDAALERGHRDDADIELDVMSLAEFQESQAPVGIPFSGPNAVVLPAPFGWVVDNQSLPQFPAVLYQRGRSFREAAKMMEWAYYGFWRKDVPGTQQSVEGLLEKQDADLLDENSATETTRIAVPDYLRYPAGIRLAKRPHHPAWEYTGVVEFPDFMFFIVLFTMPNVANRNLRKLIEAMSWVQPAKVVDADEPEQGIQQMKYRPS